MFRVAQDNVTGTDNVTATDNVTGTEVWPRYIGNRSA
jgi:hypothetical protein